MSAIGYGTKFAISKLATGTAFTECAEVLEVTPPSSTSDVVDVTHMSSPGGVREFTLGLTDPGECSIEIAFSAGSATDVLIREVRDGRALCQFRITYPNGATWVAKAYLTGYEPAIPLDDRMTATVTFKVTSSVVVTAPTAV